MQNFALHDSTVIKQHSMDMHAGLAVRMPASFLVMYGGGFTWKERLFFAFAWTPKVCQALPCLPCCLTTLTTLQSHVMMVTYDIYNTLD